LFLQGGEPVLAAPAGGIGRVDRDHRDAGVGGHLGQAVRELSAAGAGIVSPATSFSAPPAQRALAYRATAYHPELLASLRDDGITGTGHAVPGGLGGRVRRRGRCPAEPRVPDSG
jgi:hypothetical protein